MAFEDLKIEMKCKDFRIEIEEGLKGESLSIAAQDHTAGCRPCREFNQKHIEFREWLTVCRKVTAPKDFGFGVQRKIATAGASQTHGWAWNGLRYIVPAAALAAVVALSWSFFSPQPAQQLTPPAVAIMANKDVSPENTGPVQVNPADNPANPDGIAPPDQQMASAVNANKQENNGRVTVPKETIDPNRGGGSRDLGAVNVPDSKLAQGLNLPLNDPAVKRNMLVALTNLEIIANLEMNVLKVSGKAAKAGIKIGDVVKSLNGNTVTVERGGKIWRITIK